MLAGLLFVGTAVGAQIPPLPEISSATAAGNPDLVRQRAALLEERAALRTRSVVHNNKCGSVQENSAAHANCADALAVLSADVERHIQASNRFISRMRAAQTKHCEAVARQAEKDREEIEKLRRDLEASREELADWSNLNREAQMQALEAAMNFTLANYVSNLEKMSGSASKVKRHAEYLAGKASRSGKYKARMKYISRLDAAISRCVKMQGDMMAKSVVNLGLESVEAWNIARDTMYHEFRVAKKQNEAIRELLADPGFKDAFTGEEIDTPALDILSSLSEKAGEELGEGILELDRYGKITGPAISAFVFVRDATYSLTLSILSTERVLQQNDVAGNLAKASAALQNQYKRSVDALVACRQSDPGR